MALGKNAFAKKITVPRAGIKFDTKKIINVWGPPVSGKTDGIVQLVKAGYTIDYHNLDNNVAPFKQLTEEEMLRVNSIRIKDSLTKFNIANFYDTLTHNPLVNLCTQHGYLDCTACKQGGEFISFNPAKSTADLTVVDSVSAYLDSAMIKSKEQATTDKTTFNHFGAQGLHVDVFHHAIKALDNNVIVICHDLQMANTLQENYVDDYYPLLGTRPKSKRSMNIYSAVIRSKIDMDTYQVTKRKTHFATLRDPAMEKALLNKSRVEILKAILGPPKIRE